MDNWFNRLKEARLRNGFTLKDVTKEINITQQSLIEYEKGKIYPKLDMLLNLCDFYSVSLNYIVYGNENGFIIQKENDKTLECLVSLFIFDKIEIKEDVIILKDKDLKRNLEIFTYFFSLYEKQNIKNIERAAQALKKVIEAHK